MAAADRFWVNITGRGGHGALPHLSIDPVVAASQVCPILPISRRALGQRDSGIARLLEASLANFPTHFIYRIPRGAHPILRDGPAKAFSGDWCTEGQSVQLRCLT